MKLLKSLNIFTIFLKDVKAGILKPESVLNEEREKKDFLL